ncbi:T9SS type A sorting domain-containing protein [Balneola sp. MJW-20]|uniref:T9SS type A sorting domain-containing protein n=1 Tax=Gracilimonas aurantiaca TaxID=3234185 RepID=UPI00346733A0
MFRIVAYLSVLLFTSSTLLAQTGGEEYDYSDIQPIMVKYCNLCHSNGERGFKSNTYEGLINSVSPADRYNGPYIIPYDAENSPLVDKILPDPEVGNRMPLREEPVSEEEIAVIRAWIDQGAIESLVATSNENEDRPENFELLGNYPNPFNPGTIIRFNSLFPGSYRIIIYNAAGRKAAEYSGRASAGPNSIPADLSGFPSGVYFYRVTFAGSNTPSFTADGKMTLVR